MATSSIQNNKPRVRVFFDDTVKVQEYAVEKPSHAFTRGEPFLQPYYTYCFEQAAWLAQTSGTCEILQDPFITNDRLTVLSWNIDYTRALPDERMRRAMQWLEEYARTISNPCIIMLNECLESDLRIMQASEWVRMQYYVTDIDEKWWESEYYGTCVMIPKTMRISSVFRIHYSHTAMERDALMVDLRFSDNRIVRICCTHLESLVAKPPKRPRQLAEAAASMKQADVFASILAGDLNAIEIFDKTLHTDNGLKDACLEYGGVHGQERYMTWGQMASTRERKKFGLSRMDKIMYCGGLELEGFDTFGMDVLVGDDQLEKQLMDEEGLEKGWITDHLGVRGDFIVLNRDK